MRIQDGKMIKYACDLCRKDISMDELTRISSKPLAVKVNASMRRDCGTMVIWEICDTCVPRLLEFLGAGRGVGMVSH